MRISLRNAWVRLFILVLCFIGYSAYSLMRPLPNIKPATNQSVLSPRSTISHLVWPEQGQSAVGVIGSSVLERHGIEQSLPIASTAKMITALMILKAKPLNLGQNGPVISLSADDVALYNSYSSQQGSVVPVVSGEQISEYQMLEAMLLPSANNMADSLATWAYGSLADYSLAANNYLRQLGLTSTHVGSDASGFSPSTTSTAYDLVKIGEMVMQNSVLAQIVGEPSVSGLPVVNNIKNLNYLLGQNNIIGVKTGNTDQAGGVFVGAAKVFVNQQQYIVVSANLGSRTLADAVNESQALLVSAQTNIYGVNIVKSDSIVANYLSAWSKRSIGAVTHTDNNAVIWGGSEVSPAPILKPVPSNQSLNLSVGSLTSQGPGVLKSNPSSIYLTSPLPKPSLWWRLAHP